MSAHIGGPIAGGKPPPNGPPGGNPPKPAGRGRGRGNRGNRTSMIQKRLSMHGRGGIIPLGGFSPMGGSPSPQRPPINISNSSPSLPVARPNPIPKRITPARVKSMPPKKSSNSILAAAEVAAPSSPQLQHVTANRVKRPPSGRRAPTRRPMSERKTNSLSTLPVQSMVKNKPPPPKPKPAPAPIPKQKPRVAAKPAVPRKPRVNAAKTAERKRIEEEKKKSRLETVGTKKVMRVFLDNNGTSFKTLGITLPCTVETLSKGVKKKLFNVDTSNHAIHEVKNARDVRVLALEEDIEDIMDSWQGDAQFKFVYKALAPGTTIPKLPEPEPEYEEEEEEETVEEEEELPEFEPPQNAPLPIAPDEDDLDEFVMDSLPALPTVPSSPTPVPHNPNNISASAPVIPSSPKTNRVQSQFLPTDFGSMLEEDNKPVNKATNSVQTRGVPKRVQSAMLPAPIGNDDGGKRRPVPTLEGGGRRAPPSLRSGSRSPRGGASRGAPIRGGTAQRGAPPNRGMRGVNRGGAGRGGAGRGVRGVNRGGAGRGGVGRGGVRGMRGRSVTGGAAQLPRPIVEDTPPPKPVVINAAPLPKPITTTAATLPKSIAQAPKPVETAPKPVETAPKPVETTPPPKPVETTPPPKPVGSDIDTKSVEEWSVENVGEWVEKIGFPQFKDTFLENYISGLELIDLTQNELRDDLGVTALGARKAIIRELKKLQA